MSNCKDKINSTCGKITNARCVDYEGKLSSCTELNAECRSHNVHEVLEDVSEQLTLACEALDMTKVIHECLQEEYGEGELPTLPEILTMLSKKVCELMGENGGECHSAFSAPISCMGLNYSCLVDECGVEAAPKDLKELLQMLIDLGCAGGGGVTPVNKMTFYEEHVEEVAIKRPPVPSTYFLPTGYNGITYLNSSTGPQKIEVHVSYNLKAEYDVGSENTESVSSAIIRTSTSNVDTPEYEFSGEYSRTDLETKTEIPHSVNYFKVLTIGAGERVSLKFRVFDSTGAKTKLKRAQILVKEL